MKFFAELLNSRVLCNELKVKDYKEILKCTFGDEPDKDIFIETVCDVFSNITNKPADHFKNISIIDFFLLLLEVRINSQGDACKVGITKDGHQMSLELRLDYIRDEIKKSFNSIATTTITEGNIEVIFECPSTKRLLESTEEEYLFFIKNVSIKKNDSIKSLAINNNQEAKAVFDKLSPKISLKIIKQFENFLKPCTEINFLKRYRIEEQKLNFIPSIESVLWFCKLMFNESLETFYDNLFYLAHLGHLSLEYIETLSPGEYIYMTKKLEGTMSQKSSSLQDENSYVPDDIDDGFFEEQA